MVEGRREMGKSDYEYVETDPTHRYGRFKEVLGKGATKTVYRAFDELKGMEVAWNQTKLDDVFRSPEELERLYSEVHLLSTLNHNSIIRFYTSWIDVTKRTFNFITEMFTSGTLREYRRKYTRVNIRAVKKWAREILEGLVYLHQHDPPVIHRDLKCDNIFVNGHLGQVKIGDLGLAAILRTSTSAHSVIGTPEFMAPELYEEEYNELVDVYSFGMCVMEMLTSEYPYSECSNPAQIYKKVTSGKLPAAFYRIQDKEAQKFVGKCLESASKRLSAKELLLDPFLQSTGDEYPPPPSVEPNFDGVASLGSAYDQSATGTDMRITGKMNPKDDTIILKVQIADTDGTVRNIYFPFDISSDTPIDVATEMVKELEISDREPMEIAEVIDEEISALVPHWKREAQLHHHSVDYPDHDEEAQHHLYPPPSPSSSHASFAGGIPPRGENYCGEASYQREWLQDDPLAVDDASSQSSLCYSNLNYNSGNEQELDLSPRGEHHCNRKNPKSTRFCPEDHLTAECSTPPKYYDQCSTRRTTARRCLARIRSFMDIRSQILHQSLVEEVTKRRLFKTVGAVENIGFQAPCDISRESVRHSRKGKRAV